MGLQHVPGKLSAARRVMERLSALGEFTDEPGRLSRTFLSPAMRRVNAQVAEWMRAAGLATREDAAGNLIGRLESAHPSAKTFLMGSHLDTVRDAGRYDGALGVIVALASLEELIARGVRLPFHVEVIAFSDEEGVRFQSTYLGSKAIAGLLTPSDLAARDREGISVAEAMGAPAPARAYAPEDLLGYLEVHIEQGPVLEEKELPVGVVSAIAGQTRARVVFTGRASHAGTTPMSLRRDALAGASELVLAVERAGREGAAGLVATVGCLEPEPGASNVIPGRSTLTVDIRHASDSVREEASRSLETGARVIAEVRGLGMEWETVQAEPSVECSAALRERLAESVAAFVPEVVTMASGAGHDAVIMARLAPVAMLFVRCREGLSHHPDESIMEADAGVAVEVVCDFLERMGQGNE